MKIMFLCPKCQKKLEADGEACGQKVQCPTCGQAMTVPKRELQPGVTLGGFRIVRKLGEGGMGEVFLARQKSLDRDVALKVLPPQLCRDKELVARFFSEVKVLARLSHPGIVTAFEAGEDGGIHFLAMAYVPGQSLQDQIQKNGAFEEKEALRLIRKMAQALDYAWTDHKLLHRDIKPSNVLLDEHEEPKLVDFGLAKTIDQSEGLTMSGTMIGTPNYMSPEQINGEQVLDFRSDLYALGATLFHMLTGKMPYAGSSIVETLHKQMSEPLPDPRTINPRISKGCVMLLQQMLAKKREQRQGSWKAFLGDVDRVLARQLPTGTPLKEGESALLMSGAASTGSSRKTGVLIAAAILLLLAVGVTVWVLRRSPPASPVASAEPVATAPAVVAPVQVAAQPAASDAAAREAAAKEAAAREAAAKQAAALAAAQEKAALEAKARAEKAAQAEKERIAAIQAAQQAAQQAAVAKEAESKKIDAARAKEEDVLRDIADDLLKGDFNSVRNRLPEAEKDGSFSPDAGDWKAVKEQIVKVAAMQERLLASFKQDVDTEVVIGFQKGSEKLKITGVDGGGVQAKRMVTIDGAVAAVAWNFTMKELSVQEKRKRLGDETRPEVKVMCGLLAMEAAAPDKAKEYFAGSGSRLGQALTDAMDTTVSKRESGATTQKLTETEMAVQKAYEALLRAACPELAQSGIANLDKDRDGLILAIRKKNYTERLVEKVHKDLEAFRLQYGETEFSKTHAEVLDLLDLIRPQIPLYFDQAMIDKAIKKLQVYNRGVGNIDAPQMENGVITWNLANKPALSDISALAGLPIVSLDLSHTQVENLLPLRGMPLKQLCLIHTPVADLTPLKGLPLNSLKLGGDSGYGTSIADITPLSGMPLTNLFLIYTKVDDLAPLKNMPLRNLDLSLSKKITDLQVLRDMPIEKLFLWQTQITDLTPLKRIATLRELNISLSPVTDLTPLKGMTNLERLVIQGSKVSDLSPLEGMKVKVVQ